jgi:dolichyl-phosphate beta-glucosyltransferase
MQAFEGPVFLSIVIPAYNEERMIAESIRRISAYMVLRNWRYEIIVSSDGSKDKTNSIVENYKQQFPEVPVKLIAIPVNRGKGNAVRTGVLASLGDRVLVTDADLSSPIKEVDKLLNQLKDCDVAIGSRAIRAKDADVQQTLKRHISGRIFNIFVQLILLRGIFDTQCGFKGFTKDAAKKLFGDQKLEGFAFDVEILYLAKKNGLRIKEVPVMWRQGPASRVNMLRDPFLMVKDLFRIKKLH